MSGLKGDFLGFTFITNGKAYKSQDLGITRVSDGDRYNEPLIPELEDKTIEIPGLDGSYYYGSDFKSRNFPIKIAYDSLNETQFRLMRQVFGVKHTGLLILDEAPYKQYRVKIASPPELDFVCFDERKGVASNTTTPTGVRVVKRKDVPTDVSDPVTVPAQSTITHTLTDTPIGEVTVEGATAWEEGTEELVTYTVEGNTYTITNNSEEGVTVNLSYQVLVHTITREDITPWEYIMKDTDGDEIPDSYVYERIYKGEGTIEFVAYYPFATQVFKTLNEYNDTDYPNKAEWAAASRLLESIDESTELDIENHQIHLYNAGDIDMGFSLYVPFNGNGIGSDDIELLNSPYSLRILQSIEKKGNDVGFLINTVNGLVEGIDPNSIMSHPQVRYDTLLTSGNIYNEYAIGEFFKVAPGGEDKTVSTITLNGGVEGMKLYYNYLYF